MNQKSVVITLAVLLFLFSAGLFFAPGQPTLREAPARNLPAARI
jgi:hypothetical protein